MLEFLLYNSLFWLSSLVFPLFSQFRKNELNKRSQIKTPAELETNFGQKEFPCWLITRRDCVQTGYDAVEVCTHRTKSDLPLDFLSLLLQIVDSVPPRTCGRFTHAWLQSCFQWEAALQITKRLRQQKSRIKRLQSPWRPDKGWRILPLARF